MATLVAALSLLPVVYLLAREGIDPGRLLDMLDSPTTLPLIRNTIQLVIWVTLGTIVEEYEENVYGESTSPLHGGLPTDRFVCQWWIARPHVVRRLSRSAGPNLGSGMSEPLTLVSHEVAAAPVVNATSVVDGWLECGDLHLGLGDRRVGVDIPLDYTQMLSEHPDRARRWRFRTRELFTHYFSRGYRVVDFGLHREQARGRYLLTSIPPPE